jgi:hypothetical protein
METKICTKCKEEKLLCEFGKHPQTRDKLQCRCKKCRSEEKKEHYRKNKSKINKKSKNYYKHNREALLEYQKEYREKNKKILSEKAKERYLKSPEKFYLRNKEYNEKNKKKVNDKKNKYNKEKKKKCPLYRLKILMRDRLNKYYKTKSLNKNNKTFDIIGCTPEFLKIYIENKFTEGMSWDLMGSKIHIDHIVPLSSAKTEDELYFLCHYTNLQPLWAIDNLKKGSKIFIYNGSYS